MFYILPYIFTYMDISISKNKSLKLPIYDIGTFALGIYAGYADSKGFDTSTTIENFSKYGPTTLAMIATPILLKSSNLFGRWVNNQVLRNLQTGDLEVTLNNNSKKRYRNLSESERQKYTPKILDGVKTLDSTLDAITYLKPTLVVGAKTGVETALGYTFGRVLAQYI